MNEQFLWGLAKERQAVLASGVQADRLEQSALLKLLQAGYRGLRLGRKPRAKPSVQPQCCPA